jgi:hypothetical protein
MALMAVVILFTAAIRLRLLQFPLERDEGEYAYAGQLILHGVPPYLQADNMKLPGVYAAYALIMAIFGQTIGGIHLGLIVVNSASIVLVFFLVRRLFDPLAGIVASGAFALLSVSPSVLGMAAHATHFVGLMALSGALLLLRAIDNKKLITLFAAGVLFGLAFLMKQPGIFFLIFGGLYLLWNQLRARPIEWAKSIIRIASFSVGGFAPFGLTCLILLMTGAFKRFWFWTFSYARQYVSETSADAAIRYFSQATHAITRPSIWLWVLAGTGFILLWSERQAREQAIFITGFLLFSFFAVCPGFYFREQYFIVLLPAIAVLIGIAVSSARTLLHRKRVSPSLQLWLPVLVFILACGQSVIRQYEFFFELSPQNACRLIYTGNPFLESIEVAKYIKANSTASDQIAVLGSEPEIYFYADRRSATGYMYTYGLMEQQKYAVEMQQEMIRETEAARPAYLVLINIRLSWLWRSTSQMSIFEWYERYKQQYELVGIADMVSKDQTVYRWGSEVKNYTPRSDHVVYVLKLRDST